MHRIPIINSIDQELQSAPDPDACDCEDAVASSRLLSPRVVMHRPHLGTEPQHPDSQVKNSFGKFPARSMMNQEMPRKSLSPQPEIPRVGPTRKIPRLVSHSSFSSEFPPKEGSTEKPGGSCKARAPLEVNLPTRRVVVKK